MQLGCLMLVKGHRLSFLTVTLIMTALPFDGTTDAAGQGRGRPSITIRAARVLDGRGGVLTNGVVEVMGSKITAVDQRSGPVTYELADATVLPGMIDVHVHLNWIFGPSGKFGEPDIPAGFAMDAVVDNARRTLM